MLNFSKFSPLYVLNPVFLSSVILSCGNKEEQTAGKDPRVEISIGLQDPSTKPTTPEGSNSATPDRNTSVPAASEPQQGGSNSGTDAGSGVQPPSGPQDSSKGDTPNPVPVAPQPPAPATRATLTIAVNNLRNTSGNFCVSIFTSPDGFPDSADKAIFAECFSVLERSFTITLKDVPAGRYAVAGWHDENKDKQLNYNFLGIPKEGLAFSENGKPRISPPPGPPSFDSIAFDIGTTDKVTQMKTTYLLDLL